MYLRSHLLFPQLFEHHSLAVSLSRCQDFCGQLDNQNSGCCLDRNCCDLRFKAALNHMRILLIIHFQREIVSSSKATNLNLICSCIFSLLHCIKMDFIERIS